MTEDLTEIFSLIKENKYNKVELDLSRKQLSDEDVITLCELLKNNEKIRALNLSNNNLTDNSCRYILDLLDENKFLKKIKVVNKKITDEMKEKINHKLEFNEVCGKIEQNDPDFKKVGLSSKLLEDKNVIYLCSILEKNDYVEDLNLSNNALTEKSVEFLSKLLDVNKNIENININNNNKTITEKLKKELKNKLINRENNINKKSIPSPPFSPLFQLNEGDSFLSNFVLEDASTSNINSANNDSSKNSTENLPWMSPTITNRKRKHTSVEPYLNDTLDEKNQLKELKKIIRNQSLKIEELSNQIQEQNKLIENQNNEIQNLNEKFKNFVNQISTMKEKVIRGLSPSFQV